MDVVAGPGLHGPVRMPVILEGEAVGKHVFQLALPAMAPLVDRQAIDHSAVGGLLQVQIERGLHAQAGFVDLLGAEALFQFAADFFLKPGRDRRSRLGDMQDPAARCGLPRPARA